MKRSILSLALLAAISTNANAVKTLKSEQEYFKSSTESLFELMQSRFELVRSLASEPSNIILEDSKRWIEYNGRKYQLNSDDYPLMPLLYWSDESAIRNMFDFISEDWELSNYQGGVVAVNKYFGNYDYGNGCLVEYYPDGVVGTNGIERIIMETSSCSVNSFNTEVSYFGDAEVLEPADFGVETFQSTAIERYNNNLYVVKDVKGNSYVDIFDVKTKTLVGRIDGYPTNNGQTTPYSHLNELFIQGNRLFVTSWESNRVDVYDLDNNHQYLMSIGIDGKTGEGIYRPQAVTGNQDYLIVSDSRWRIAVIKQDQVTVENSNKMARYASLAFGEGQYSHRLVQMHVIGDYLLVNTSNKDYYIYDLRKVEQAALDGIDLQPEKMVTTAPNKIDLDGNTLIINIAGRLEWHSVDSFIANNFEFVEPTGSVHQLNNENVPNFQDIHFSNNELVTINSDRITINPYIVNSEVRFSQDIQLDIPQIQLDLLMPNALKEIYTNDEPYELITNPSLRSARINELVKVNFIDKNTVQITNYTAKTLHNVDIQARLNGVNKWFVLGNFDKLPPFTQITLPMTAFGQSGQFNSVNGDGVFDLQTLIYGSDDFTDLLETTFNSQTDTFVHKLKKIKPRWRIQTNTAQTGNWLKMGPMHAREYLIMLTNFAYMASSEEFKHFWFNFSELYGNGQEFYGNAGQVDGPGGNFKPEDYQYYYDGMMNRDYLNLGVVHNVLGLGNHAITGIAESMFYQHYYGYYGILAHEFGHGFDGKGTYNDGTAFAASWFGFQPMMTELGMYLIRKGDIPYTSEDEDINGFYKDENAQYRHFPATGSRTHRPDSNNNKFDDFLMASSDMPQGWFNNSSDFDYEHLSNHERAAIAKIKKDGQQLPLCRFTYNEDDKATMLYGYVEKLAQTSYRCTGGSELSYRNQDGSKVNFASAENNFQWLSLHNPAEKGEQATADNGLPLCTINNDNFYGVGFQKPGAGCGQSTEVYWSNGNRWYFSSGFSHYLYR